MCIKHEGARAALSSSAREPMIDVMDLYANGENADAEEQKRMRPGGRRAPARVTAALHHHATCARSAK
jgi:hypothetical protein